MCSKIRCDGESEKFCKIFWELNWALLYSFRQTRTEHGRTHMRRIWRRWWVPHACRPQRRIAPEASAWSSAASSPERCQPPIHAKSTMGGGGVAMERSAKTSRVRVEPVAKLFAFLSLNGRNLAWAIRRTGVVHGASSKLGEEEQHHGRPGNTDVSAGTP
jgi:hypothetical protein